MQGLAPHTEQIIDAISKLECIKPYTLVGGTALAIQIDHRKSEDLDFMRWINKKSENPEVNWPTIANELKTIDSDLTIDVLDVNHVNFMVKGVRVTFYTAPRKSPLTKAIHLINNLSLADIDSIAVMKMELFLRRAKYRDYYDLYAILKDKQPHELKELISKALAHSDYKLKSKSLLAMLTNSARLEPDINFETLEPKIATNLNQIEQFMKETVQKAYLSDTKI